MLTKTCSPEVSFRENLFPQFCACKPCDAHWRPTASCPRSRARVSLDSTSHLPPHRCTAISCYSTTWTLLPTTLLSLQCFSPRTALLASSNPSEDVQKALGPCRLTATLGSSTTSDLSANYSLKMSSIEMLSRVFRRDNSPARWRCAASGRGTTWARYRPG